jgi:hypothetical protein
MGNRKAGGRALLSMARPEKRWPVVRRAFASCVGGGGCCAESEDGLDSGGRFIFLCSGQAVGGHWRLVDSVNGRMFYL